LTSIEFKLSIKQSVKITNINTLGTVIGYYVGDSGIQYQVAYFLNGERKVMYLYEEELGDPKEDTGIGFITK